MSSISSNRLVGSGFSSNNLQSISIGSGLSLSGGTLTNTRSSGLTGGGSAYNIAIWSGSSTLTSNHSSSSTYPLQLRYPRNLGGAGGILYYSTSNYEVFYQYSRAIHKTKVEDISTTIEDLMNWRAVEFKWKEQFGGEHDIGLIAEEVAEVYPRAALYDQPWVYTDEETGAYELDEDGAPKKIPGEKIPSSVKYEKAWLPMLAAVQDFYRKYQELEAEVKELKAEVKGLKTKLGDKQ